MPPDRNAQLLGLAGLIPFWGFALGALLVSDAVFAAAAMKGLIGWGAIILSFMTGARWAMILLSGTASSARLALFGGLPALSLATLFLAPLAALVLLIAGFGALLALERTSEARAEAPDWYPALRLKLSAAAILALVIALPLA